MPRMRRLIKARGLYEITFRAREVLPFPCTSYMSMIIYSVLSRVQRDQKVLLHHLIFEGSHPHIVCTAQDAEQCHRFYGEVQKQLTDAIKRLTGLTHLNIWEGRATVVEIPTLEDAIDKIAYVYSNPSNDNLVESIEKYPGVSSWRAFSAARDLSSCIASEHPWIRLPMIPSLPSRSVTSRQDKFLCEEMLKASKKKHSLKIYPNLWIKRFIKNPTAQKVESVCKEIKERIEGREFENLKQREKSHKTPLGVEMLRKQPLLKAHTPKKHSRKIFVQSQFKEIRIQLIQEMKWIDSLCRKVYRTWKRGDFRLLWPPGTFPPPLSPQASILLA